MRFCASAHAILELFCDWLCYVYLLCGVMSGVSGGVMPESGSTPKKMDSRYMIGVVAEYIRTLNHHRLVVTPLIMRFLVDLLASSGRFYELHQFIQYKVVHDSEAVAEQLLTLQEQHPASFQLSIDMLQRLGASERIVDLLLQNGQVLNALLYTRRHKMKNLPVRRFLEAALQCNDEVVMFTVFRYFRNQKEYDELLPQFQQGMRAIAENED